MNKSLILQPINRSTINESINPLIESPMYFYILYLMLGLLLVLMNESGISLADPQAKQTDDRACWTA